MPRVNLTLFVFVLVSTAHAEDNLSSALTFYASFDDSADADFARGDRRIYTAKGATQRSQATAGISSPSVSRVDDHGRWNGALQFGKRTEQVVFFRGEKNVAFDAQRLEGTVSLWMRLSPDEDLEPGYVDPLQITDKKWNDSCFFLDFTKDEKPRHFRLGVFSDYKFWNATDRKFDNIPESERPMVVVKRPPFTRDKWTHVAFTYSRINTRAIAEAQLYIDGKSVGQLTRAQQFNWKPKDVVIMLGIYYTGLVDELAIFDRGLSVEEIQKLRMTSVAKLLPDSQ